MANDVKVKLNPVANNNAGPNERIIEFSSPAGGGLISFWLPGDGTLTVQVCGVDATVNVVPTIPNGERK